MSIHANTMDANIMGVQDIASMGPIPPLTVPLTELSALGRRLFPSDSSTAYAHMPAQDFTSPLVDAKSMQRRGTLDSPMGLLYIRDCWQVNARHLYFYLVGLRPGVLAHRVYIFS